MTDKSAAKKQLLKDVWQKLSNTVLRVGELIKNTTDNADYLVRTEGYRHALRMQHYSVDMLVEHADYKRPNCSRTITPTFKLFGDDPDVYYVLLPYLSD